MVMQAKIAYGIVLLGEGQGSGRKALFVTLAEIISFF